MYTVGTFISKGVSLILGLIAVFIALFLTLVTACDVAYLAFPFMKGLMKVNFKGKELGGLRIVSKDAIKAYEDGCSTDQSPWVLYLKYRFKAYIIAALTLFLMVTGGESLREFITNILLDVLVAFKFI